MLFNARCIATACTPRYGDEILKNKYVYIFDILRRKKYRHNTVLRAREAKGCGGKREKLEIQIDTMRKIYMYTVHDSDDTSVVYPEGKGENTKREARFFRAFCVWGRGQFIKKPCSAPSAPRRRPLKTVNRIFIILRRWHFPVIFSFYDHFSSLSPSHTRVYTYIHVRIQHYRLTARKKPPTLPPSRTKAPFASFLTCKMTWKLNPRARDTLTFVRTYVYCIHTHKVFYFILFSIFISRVYVYSACIHDLSVSFFPSRAHAQLRFSTSRTRRK